MGIQSLTLKCLARVLSLKSFLEKLLFTISWVMRDYIVLVKVCEKAHSNIIQEESFAGHSRLGLSRE